MCCKFFIKVVVVKLKENKQLAILFLKPFRNPIKDAYKSLGTRRFCIAKLGSFELTLTFAGPDNDEGGLVTYDDYVPLADESPATGMDEITVLTLIGGLVLLLGVLSCLAWFKTKFGVPCCSAAKTG